MTRSNSKIACALLFLLLPVLLSGCGREGATQEIAQRVTESRGTIEVPLILPRILVDQKGYATGSEKLVVFPGDLAGDTFEVRNKTDDAVVYTGSIRAGETTDRSVGYGLFTAFQTEGDYYIYNETLGSSFAFRIQNDLTEALRREVLLAQEASGGWNTDAEGRSDAVMCCNAVRDLLLSYEIHASRYGDDAGITGSANGIPDLLDTVKQEIEWLNTMQITEGGEVALAHVLARFAYIYGAFDQTYADDCFAGAQAAWDLYCAGQSPYQDTTAFAAASELYRITGEKHYENVLSSFFNREDFTNLLREDDEIFYGCVTYLASTQPVNVAVRNQIRDTLLARCGEIVADAAESPYLVAGTDHNALIREMCRLSVANEMQYNPAYAGVIENHIHYLAGRNPDAVNYASDDTEYTYPDTGAEGALATPENRARFVLMTGGI